MNGPDEMDDSQWEDTSNILFRQLKTIPRELRDLIYEFVVTESSDILITPDDRRKSEQEVQLRCIHVRPALLSICHQIRWEATEAYYHANIFRAIISDDQTFMAPFKWISQLSDREANSVRKLKIEFRLSKDTKERIDKAIHEYKEAYRTHAVANAAVIDPVFRSQITQRLQTKLQDIVRVEIFNSISVEMRTIRDTGRFDLYKMSFEGSDISDYAQVCDIWRSLLDKCLQATRNGKHMELESARTNVTTV